MNSIKPITPIYKIKNHLKKSQEFFEYKNIRFQHKSFKQMLEELKSSNENINNDIDIQNHFINNNFEYNLENENQKYIDKLNAINLYKN